MDKNMNKKKSSFLILYAPGIHSGGGLKLIQSIIGNIKNSLIFVDHRLPAKEFNNSVKKIIVHNTFLGRLNAELKLYKIQKNKKNSIILCLNGIPPFFLRQNKNLILFLQNSIHLDTIKYSKLPFNLNTLKIFLSRIFLNILHYKVETFIVQTPTMKRLILQKFKNKEKTLPKVKILPFIPKTKIKKNIKIKKKWDFIYVADSYPHKNHKMLIEAWVELSRANIRPSLALTIKEENKNLLEYINMRKKKYKLKIYNLGFMSSENLEIEYHRSFALIYPSLNESFGLPLIEALKFNLPIIASELDYVRDVCVPKQTFNPNSFISIARAVQRHLKIKRYNLKIYSSNSFMDKIFRINKQN
jgi:glycosyltransferase involved in cell wall biosynthesis